MSVVIFCLWKIKWKNRKFKQFVLIIMIFDVIVGNPPYGKDTKGSSKKLHFNLMKSALSVCGDKLCFIMPSKCLYDMSLNDEREMLKKAVCENIDIVSRSTFVNTQMPETAIYFCRKDGKYCSKLDVCNDFVGNDIEEKIFALFDTKSTMFKYTIRIDGSVNDDMELNNVCKKFGGYRYFINLSYANFAQNGEWFAQNELKDIGVLDIKGERNFIRLNATPKFVLKFMTFESAYNVYNLLHTNLMRFCLWIVQDDRNMKQKVYKLFPDMDYNKITDEYELLDCLGCHDVSEQKRIIDFVNNFDFNKKKK